MDEKVLSQFPIALPLRDVKALTNGIINTTDLITDSNGERYIFQRIIPLPIQSLIISEI